MPTVGIIGAGAMGAGIAQVAATAGWHARLVDVDPATVENALSQISKRLQRSVDKGRLDATSAGQIHERLTNSTIQDLADCDLLIEAIVENLDTKVAAISPVLDVLAQDTLIATNTSSLSVTELGNRLGCGPRIAGMHFFNPAPVMKLVEVVRGHDTSTKVVDRVADIATAWGKQVAHCADTPGFIVNRVARPFYLEAFRCLEDGIADPASIDHAMKSAGGFRMGPFELTDFIGHDVNTATTRSVWEGWNQPDRLKPSATQERLVADGHLGRKSECGVYDWSGDSPIAVIRPGQDAATNVDALADIAQQLTLAASEDLNTARSLSPAQQTAFARILTSVINEAQWAYHDGVADQEDIDIAMRAGVNYPLGPFAWGERIGWPLVEAFLSSAAALSDDTRFTSVHQSSTD